MAENRVTAETVETAIIRASVPGDARLTSHSVEVALLKDVVPGGFARLTVLTVEVAIVRPTGNAARAGDFFFAQ